MDNKTKGSGKKFNKNRKFNSRSKSFKAPDEVKGSGKNITCNDPVWYLHNAQAASDVANFAYSTPLGYKMTVRPWLGSHSLHWESVNSGLKYECTPGMLGLEVAQIAPTSTDADSALNVAMHNLYTDIRYMNSGSRNYDAPDLFIYTFAQVSLRAYIAWMQRTYAFAKMYTQQNGYMPHAYYALNHLDWNSFRGRDSIFHDGILQRLHQLKKWFVPGDMDIFKRYAFLYRDVYTEGVSWKDQQYMFVPASFMKFSYDDDGAGCMIQRYIKDGEYLSMESMFAIFDELYDAVNAEESFHIMSGDIYKAKGDSCLPLNTDFPKDYTIAPVFSIEILEQIKNARCVGGDYVPGINSLYQDSTKAYLISTPQTRHTWDLSVIDANAARAARATLWGLGDNIVLTTATDKVGSALTMTNSRLACMSIKNEWPVESETTMTVVDTLCVGTELPYRFLIADYEVSNNTGNPRDLIIKQYEYNHNIIQNTTGGDVHSALRLVHNLSSFKYHPAVSVWTTVTQTSTPGYAVAGIDLFYDIDNFQVMDVNELERVHNVAVLSLFGIYG